ncbi:MAG: hypothetical protein ACREV0_04520 [Burkholderiales bacterium]
MSEFGEVKRRHDGSIDIEFYEGKARRLRTAAAGEFLSKAAVWLHAKVFQWTHLRSSRCPEQR